MKFLLSSENVFEYLLEQGLGDTKEQELSEIKLKSGKNFNLLVSFANDRHLLVKQERHDLKGQTKGEFLKEWRIHEFLQKFPELSHIRPLITEAIHFDPSRSIIVFNYLNDYCDLSNFYIEEQIFPTAIAAEIGVLLAAIHRTTLDHQEYKDFLAGADISIDKTPNFLRRLKRIGTEVFGEVCADALKFFELYQRYESFGQAIAELNTAFEPCCLTHNDLKLNNILLHLDWVQTFSKAERSPLASQTEPGNQRGDPILRLIDWERWNWGDPAFDLGSAIASYLRIWLTSLVINTDLDVETALRLAITPLETLQPSIVALTKTYFDRFPEIISRRPDFLRRVVQFTGFALIKKIQTTIQYQEPFGNIGICMLQVAKTLLCHPEQSIPIIFGTTASELTCLSCLPDLKVTSPRLRHPSPY
jgi:hypothetical protein